MFLNYDKILKNHISIISKDSWISKNIENKNIIFTTKFNSTYLLFNLINNNKYAIFICHDQKIYKYLNILKYYFKDQLIILMINHNSYKIELKDFMPSLYGFSLFNNAVYEYLAIIYYLVTFKINLVNLF